MNTLFLARFSASRTTNWVYVGWRKIWGDGPGHGQRTECQRIWAWAWASHGIRTPNVVREVRASQPSISILQELHLLNYNKYCRSTTSWHLGAPRMPGYSGGTDEDSAPSSRSWNNSNGGNATNRNSGDQAEWASNKMFRK